MEKARVSSPTVPVSLGIFAVLSDSSEVTCQVVVQDLNLKSTNLVRVFLQHDISDILDLTFSMDADEEKHILYEKTEVWHFCVFRIYIFHLGLLQWYIHLLRVSFIAS